MLYLLDTDHFSLLERGTTEGVNIKKRLRVLSLDDYGICVVTYAEQAKGWLARVAVANTPDEEVGAFGKLQKSLRYCTAFAIWEYTADAATICAELRRAKVRIGTQDRRIASVALANNATVLTCNTRDFARVPNLLFADWTV